MSARKDGQPKTGDILERGAVIAMLRAEPMTRHALMQRTGCSRHSADQMISMLQAARLVEPCGRERGMDGKWWRTVFRVRAEAAA